MGEETNPYWCIEARCESESKWLHVRAGHGLKYFCPFNSSGFSYFKGTKISNQAFEVLSSLLGRFHVGSLGHLLTHFQTLSILLHIFCKARFSLALSLSLSLSFSHAHTNTLSHMHTLAHAHTHTRTADALFFTRGFPRFISLRPTGV